MDNVINKLNAVKSEILNLSYDLNNNDDFKNLVRLRGIDDELYETLILMHSNYKAEFHSLKTAQIKNMVAIVDTNLEAINAMNKVAASNNKPPNSNLFVAIKPFITFKNILFVFTLSVLGIGFMWWLFGANMETSKFVLELIRELKK